MKLKLVSAMAAAGIGLMSGAAAAQALPVGIATGITGPISSIGTVGRALQALPPALLSVGGGRAALPGLPAASGAKAATVGAPSLLDPQVTTLLGLEALPSVTGGRLARSLFAGVNAFPVPLQLKQLPFTPIASPDLPLIIRVPSFEVLLSSLAFLGGPDLGGAVLPTVLRLAYIDLGVPTVPQLPAFGSVLSGLTGVLPPVAVPGVPPLTAIPGLGVFPDLSRLLVLPSVPGVPMLPAAPSLDALLAGLALPPATLPGAPMIPAAPDLTGLLGGFDPGAITGLVTAPDLSALPTLSLGELLVIPALPAPTIPTLPGVPA